MKNPRELFEECPKQDTLTVKIKGYRRFKVDELRLRYIQTLVNKGKLKASDVTVIDIDGKRYHPRESGRFREEFKANTMTVCSDLTMELF